MKSRNVNWAHHLTFSNAIAMRVGEWIELWLNLTKEWKIPFTGHQTLNDKWTSFAIIGDNISNAGFWLINRNFSRHAWRSFMESSFFFLVKLLSIAKSFVCVYLFAQCLYKLDLIANFISHVFSLFLFTDSSSYVTITATRSLSCGT